jgi:hypothetical protein
MEKASVGHTFRREKRNRRHRQRDYAKNNEKHADNNKRFHF